jgi:deoxycytidylate deaminase
MSGRGWASGYRALIAELRHECAASGMHDYDGCGCGEGDLIQRSGYRILAPGEIDPETVERCAAVADAQRIYKARSQPDHCSYHLHAEQEARAIAARIRHLSDKEQGT